MPDCIFCKIVRGDLPSIQVYEDEHTFAFLTIQPVSAGHTLVVPKEHAGNIFEISPETWHRVATTVHRLAPAIDKALGADGMNITNNNREHGGQTVHHLHVHLIPRFKDDGLKLMPFHDRRDDEGEPVAERIRRALP